MLKKFENKKYFNDGKNSIKIETLEDIKYYKDIFLNKNLLITSNLGEGKTTLILEIMNLQKKEIVLINRFTEYNEKDLKDIKIKIFDKQIPDEIEILNYINERNIKTVFIDEINEEHLNLIKSFKKIDVNFVCSCNINYIKNKKLEEVFNDFHHTFIIKRKVQKRSKQRKNIIIKTKINELVKEFL